MEDVGSVKPESTIELPPKYQGINGFDILEEIAGSSQPTSPTYSPEIKAAMVPDAVNDISITVLSNGNAGTDVNGKALGSTQLPVKKRLERQNGKHFDSFTTFSGEPQTFFLTRYFRSLEGVELDTLKGSVESSLPEDWPFLLRCPITIFGVCLGTSSQAILWKTLATSPSTSFLHIDSKINLILWCMSVAIVAVVLFTYSLKIYFYPGAMRREYYHPFRINFFFAPWIALLFLALGMPRTIVKDLPQFIWYILMTPILCLELKLYGQWISGTTRILSKVASPANHLAIVGNFVGALLGASLGLKEGPVFFFAVGLAHYMVLFVTLYQNLPTNERLPKNLHPVYFLFVAAPSVASMAWAGIQGKFDFGSRIFYFVAMFLYCSLAVRVNFFRGFKFSLSWWAYTFPMTGAAIATIRYSNEVKNPVTQSLAVLLSAVSAIIVTLLLVSTIIHAFVLRDLFPNDMAISLAHIKDNQATDQQTQVANKLKWPVKQWSFP